MGTGQVPFLCRDGNSIELMSKVFGGALLIAGSTVGVGILAAPVFTGIGGFIPSIILYSLTWLFSIASGWCYLEVMTRIKSSHRVNMSSMAQYMLGGYAKTLMCLVYIFLLYSLLIAYFCEIGNMIMRISSCLRISSLWIQRFAFILFPAFFCPLLILKTKFVDYANRLLVFGLIFTMIIFYRLGAGKLEPQLLFRSSWNEAIYGLPILFLAFGFQNIIPSLYYYMDGKINHIRRSIIIGSILSLVLFITWEAFVLGVMPFHFLLEAKIQGYTLARIFRSDMQCSSLYFVTECLAFFALSSSFITISLGGMDFFSDVFDWDKKKHCLSILSLTFLAPLAWARTYPCVVLKCLYHAGYFSSALIIGCFPVLMLWRGSQLHRLRRLLPTHHLILFLMLCFVVINFFLVLK